MDQWQSQFCTKKETRLISQQVWSHHQGCKSSTVELVAWLIELVAGKYCIMFFYVFTGKCTKTMIWFVFLNVLWATQMIQFCCNPGRGIGGEVVFQRLDHTFLPVGARAWCRASGDFSTSYWDFHHKMLLQVITREAPGMINLSVQRIFYFWQCLMIRFYTDIVFSLTYLHNLDFRWNWHQLFCGRRK